MLIFNPALAAKLTGSAFDAFPGMLVVSSRQSMLILRDRDQSDCNARYRTHVIFRDSK